MLPASDFSFSMSASIARSAAHCGFWTVELPDMYVTLSFVAPSSVNTVCMLGSSCQITCTHFWKTRVALQRVMSTLKGVSARNANAELGRVGEPFWQDESFDHWIRDSSQFERIRSYIEQNPVKAGLAKKPEDWQWSSARK